MKHAPKTVIQLRIVRPFLLQLIRQNTEMLRRLNKTG
jgi:hypothetical protein